MAVSPPVCNFGWKAPGFSLPATDGRTLGLPDIAGPKGTLVMFICNHCPYVLAVLDRIQRDAADLMALGIGVVAISSSDATAYPEDGFDQMARMAAEWGFQFPYLYDESQDVARAWGAPVRPISLASTQKAGCNIAAGWMHRAETPARPMPGASCMRRCGKLPKPGAGQKCKWHQWDVQSNGRPCDDQGCHCLRP